jgi:hypothetical protein
MAKLLFIQTKFVGRRVTTNQNNSSDYRPSSNLNTPFDCGDTTTSDFRISLIKTISTSMLGYLDHVGYKMAASKMFKKDE